MTPDPGLGAEAAEFGARVRAFLEREMAGVVADAGDLTGVAEEFERELSRRAGGEGLLGSAVGEEHGGPGRTASHQAVFDYTAAACDAPLVDTALTLAGHPLLHDAGPAQQAYFLPRMLRGELLMCVAYTEADAGTDLRAITTTATADGDGYLLRGVKTLVTGAHKADWCVTIARTGEAFTMFLVPMAADGVLVRRRPTMNGWTLDEIEFDGVRLGPEAVLGRPGGAWRQLVAAVRAERSGLFYLGFARHVLDLLVDHVRTASRGGLPLAGDPLVRDALAGLEIDVEAGTLLAARAVGEPECAPMAKVFGTELLQRLAASATEIAGHAGTVWAPPHGAAPRYAAGGGRFAWEYLERVHGTIGAGANEVLRDTIAQQLLGLPREGAPGSAPARSPVPAGAPAPAAPGAPEVSEIPTTSVVSQGGVGGARGGVGPDPVVLLALMESAPGYDAAWWRDAVRAGEFGGSFTATVGAIRRLAGAAVPSPVHNGLIQSGALLEALGADDDLAALRAGARRYAFCLTEPDGGYAPESVRAAATPDGPGWRLHGTKCFVPYAADADVLLVVARTPAGHGVFAVDRTAPGVSIEPIPTIGLDHQCAIHLDAAPARALTTYRGLGRAEDPDDPAVSGRAGKAVSAALARGAIALAADALGAADAAMRHAVERVTVRRIRGTPLGSRQAVAHRCADMLLDVTLVAGVVDRAARLVDEGAPAPDVARAAAIAKTAAAHRCRAVTASAHQLCGGDGIHADRPAHLWYRRVKAAEPALGDPRTHRAATAATLLDPEGTA